MNRMEDSTMRRNLEKTKQQRPLVRGVVVSFVSKGRFVNPNYTVTFNI